MGRKITRKEGWREGKREELMEGKKDKKQIITTLQIHHHHHLACHQPRHEPPLLQPLAVLHTGVDPLTGHQISPLHLSGPQLTLTPGERRDGGKNNKERQ